MKQLHMHDYDKLYALPARWWMAKKVRREWHALLRKIRFRQMRINHLGLDLKIPLPSRLGKYLIVPNEFYMSKCIHAFLTLKAGAAIDIGVHAGEFLVRFKAACQAMGNDAIEYYGFEPNFASYCFTSELILANSWLPQCRLFPVAIADQEGLCPLHAGRLADPCSSIHPEVNPGSGDFDTLVTMFSGDHFLKLLSLDAISMIKIDAEGAELEILTGLQRTLSRCRPFIHCEIAKIPPSSAPNHAFLAARNRAIVDLMTSMDYLIYAIIEDADFYHHIIRRGHYLPRIEGPVSDFNTVSSGCGNYFMAHKDDMADLLALLAPDR
ncbi:MAG: FkbM family methyltransferase [Desulfurivibrio sp.]|nr:FkbM family methyltransferase [Desulfurivibrio sp.]